MNVYIVDVYVYLSELVLTLIEIREIDTQEVWLNIS